MAERAPKRQQRRRRGQMNETQELEKAIEILRLRRKGETFRAIGEAVGLGHKTAWEIHRKYLEQLRRVSEEEADDIRTLELVRLDSALEEVTKILEHNADPDVRLRAVDRLIKISERRTKLKGVEAPDQTELKFPAGQVISLEVDRMSTDELDRELEGFFAGHEAGSKNGRSPKAKGKK